MELNRDSVDTERKKVSVHCQPQLYTDLFKSILRSISVIGVVEDDPHPSTSDSNQDPPNMADRRGVDVLLVSLDDHGRPDIDNLDDFPHAKIIALPVDCDYGYVRLPGETRWEQVWPFKLSDLLYEILSEGS